LINVILPIFDKYPLFSNKNFYYLRLRNVVLSKTVLYEAIPEYIRPSVSFNSMESIVNVPYFSA